jgi:hypothetical protein
MASETRIHLTNYYSHDVTLYLEPWAEELQFGQKKTFAITMACSSDDVLGIQICEEGFVVIGSIYSIVRVFKDDLQIWESYSYIPYRGPF